MRGEFLDALFEEMKTDESLFFMTADMGINLVEKFEEEFPNRFLNVGIAEQNLIGIAAGLAESGMRPYVYTISNFLVHRALEQIRNDLVLHNLPVTLIGTSTGYDNGALGPTHHMLEDWGILSAFPNLRIFSPFDKQSAREIFQVTLSTDGTKYVRIPKGQGLGKRVINDETVNKNNIVVSYGSAVTYAYNFSVAHNLSFFPIFELGRVGTSFLSKEFLSAQRITVIEDHFSHIGMYSYICQWVQEHHLNCEVNSVAPSDYSLTVGHDLVDFLK